MELKEKTSEIEIEAENNLKNFKESLEIKLKDRDKHLSEFEQEKQQLITAIEEERHTIESLYNEIKNIIKIKNGNCLQESKDLITWSLNDSQSDLFSRPIQWVYMPMYSLFLEDQETGEEKMKLLFPGIVSSNPTEIYKELSDELMQLKERIDEKFEEDIALRSNFEFSAENKNLLQDKSFNKRVQQGITILRNINIINNDMEQLLRNNLNRIVNT
ncbi:MAG: hypothetical protein ACFE9R_08085 [Candidatus Hermodarchaeota archaeon]